MGAFSTFKSSDELFESMSEILRSAQAPAVFTQPVDPKTSKSPTEDNQNFQGIVEDRKKAIEMLEWMVSKSPVIYGKPEAKKVLAFLSNMNVPNFDRSRIGKDILIPTAMELDKIAAALCFYRNNEGQPLNHNLLVQDVAMLLKALRDYKDYFAQVDPEETVKRWETAIQNAKSNRIDTYNSNPELKQALLTAVKSESNNSNSMLAQNETFKPTTI